MPIADDINHHRARPVRPARTRRRRSTRSAIWKFSKNIAARQGLHPSSSSRRRTTTPGSSPRNAFNHPPLRHLADHPIWARNPKFAMLPKEAEFAHARGWPAKPNDAVSRIEVNYVLPDMVAKAVNGMPTKRAMAWGAGPGGPGRARASSRQSRLAMAVGSARARGGRRRRGPAVSRACASGGSRSTSSATA